MVMKETLDHELVNNTTNLLSILSKKDAMSIFLLAKSGLKAESDTPPRIGLTRKQYYTRLKQLVDIGLIYKSGDVYVHTTLGTFVHQKHLMGLLEHLRNAKQMKMVDTLKRTRNFSEDEIAKFIGKLTAGCHTTSASPTRFVTTLEDMVSDVIEQIQHSRSEILLASRFQNDLIIDNILHKSNSGVSIRMIVDTNTIRNSINNVRQKLLAKDKQSMEHFVARDRLYPQRVMANRKLRDVPFCILVVDGKSVGLEIVDRFDSDKFKYALFVEDKLFAEEMRKVFESWWAGAHQDNIQKLFEEMLT